MVEYADLEIGLSRADSESYRVDFRFSPPGSEADVRLPGNRTCLARFDWKKLKIPGHDSTAYGKFLGQSLFADEALRTTFAQARASVEAIGANLRLRLVVDQSSPELHALRWETMITPQDGALLATSQRILFSRYLSSQDWRRVKLRPQSNLRALVAVASPSDIADYKLGAIDKAEETRRARVALGAVPVTELAATHRTTLDGLSSKLREDYDILYLVCHGALTDGESRLYLEDEAGATSVVSGSDLVTRINELQQPPRLVILASCQSANLQATDGSALCALGPRLAAAGVAAVVAMQGNVSMQTSSVFMETFFKELVRDGQIDRAMGAARGAVRERFDSWMPVLFMRLRSGRISYVPGFGHEHESMAKWPALLGHIKDGRCTPILGPGLTEYLLGSRREIAARWAETSGYPMNPDGKESLPQVAQYVAVDQDFATMQRMLQEHLVNEVRRRYGDLDSAKQPNASFDELISNVGRKLMTEAATQPIRMLASLPLPIYITTNFSNTLADALVAVGKKPVVEVCRWNEQLECEDSVFDSKPKYRPTPEQPLVYHLFGRLSNPSSLVLTEDEYFDFLIGVTSRNELIPGVVRRALTDTALLFLGFELDEWDFRVLFRSIMNREGRSRRNFYSHVAAQIDPDGSRITEPEGAKKYLETYFGDADISIFWGTVADFGNELEQRTVRA